ncbi:hypothetical protein [Granulicella paludicola]|uniref:hypothetical protein n=1 Tax=Granulicella paludicola TaxID=474951 RepID=UPI0021E0CD4C|nr:hypothetical protein [Granulicella paludicola]
MNSKIVAATSAVAHEDSVRSGFDELARFIESTSGNSVVVRKEVQDASIPEGPFDPLYLGLDRLEVMLKKSR